MKRSVLERTVLEGAFISKGNGSAKFTTYLAYQTVVPFSAAIFTLGEWLCATCDLIRLRGTEVFHCNQSSSGNPQALPWLISYLICLYQQEQKILAVKLISRLFCHPTDQSSMFLVAMLRQTCSSQADHKLTWHQSSVLFLIYAQFGTGKQFAFSCMSAYQPLLYNSCCMPYYRQQSRLPLVHMDFWADWHSHILNFSGFCRLSGQIQSTVSSCFARHSRLACLPGETLTTCFPTLTIGRMSPSSWDTHSCFIMVM